MVLTNAILQEGYFGIQDYYPIVTDNGNLYFNSQREWPGTNDIVYFKVLMGSIQAEKLPEPINTLYREFDEFC